MDIVYLQAKRYGPGNTVGVEKVREFAGSLVERGATKGVFVTTSGFAPAARTYVDRIPQRLILIDGDELTRLMVQYGVGSGPSGPSSSGSSTSTTSRRKILELTSMAEIRRTGQTCFLQSNQILSSRLRLSIVHLR